MKSVIMIGGGVQEAPAVERIQKLGYKVIVTDFNKEAAAFEFADFKVNIGARDVNSLISWVMHHREKLNIKGVFTLINQAPSVAIIANATKLPTLSIETIFNCDNKLIMKNKFQELGIPSAKFVEISTIDEALREYKKFGNGTIYIKAADGFGGKGVRKVESVDELKNAIESIWELSDFPFLLMEEYLVGDFIDAQGVFYNGKFYRAGIDDCFFEAFEMSNPIEVLNISPSLQPREVIDSTYELLEKASKKMGMKWGPVSADFILTEEGLKIIELAPRLHGPNGTLQIVPESTGIKPLEFMVETICEGDPKKDYLVEKFNNYSIYKVLTSNKNNVTDVKIDKEISEATGFVSYFVNPNLKKQKMRKTSISGIIGVCVKGNTYEEAKNNLKMVEDKITFLTSNR